jgi:hypothetical protein
MDDRDAIPGRGNDGIFLFTAASRRALRPTQPPTHWIEGVISPEINQTKHEATPPFSNTS